jgi:hypothetical protein
MRSSRFIRLAAVAVLAIGAFITAAPQETGAAPSQRTAHCFWARNVENFA